MSSKILNTYDRYMHLVTKARTDRNLSNAKIIEELENEAQHIENRCRQKQIELAQNPTPYPGREARRAATECIMVIQRIIRGLKEESK